MSDEKNTRNGAKPDPEMLKNLELLQELEKLEMIRDLHLQEDLGLPADPPKTPATVPAVNGKGSR